MSPVTTPETHFCSNLGVAIAIATTQTGKKKRLPTNPPLLRFEPQQIWHVKNEMTNFIKKSHWKSGAGNNEPPFNSTNTIDFHNLTSFSTAGRQASSINFGMTMECRVEFVLKSIPWIRKPMCELQFPTGFTQKRISSPDNWPDAFQWLPCFVKDCHAR
jgi:hypothetical protein